MIRGLVGNVARSSAGLWQGLADALEPAAEVVRPARPMLVPDPPSETPPPIGPSGDEVAAPVAAGEAMLVPIDSWRKLLDQLGNLHEAGQQLAEARERAARAETEATFLREQLADARRTPTDSVAADPIPDRAVTAGLGPAERSAAAVRRARDRVRSWVG